MSELINTHDNRATIRWKLLTGASALALTVYVSSAGMAGAEDTSQPQIWIELGGGFDQMDNAQASFQRPFASPPPSFQDFSLTGIQKPSQSALNLDGKISFQPEDSDWVFSAELRFGRSKRGHHSQAQPKSSCYFVPSYGFSLCSPVYAFADAVAKNSERHEILDFKAGKDVGLGLFDKGTSILSVGVRYAQLKSHTSVQFTSQPATNTQYGDRYKASLTAQRDFTGIGPSISWDASAPFAGNADSGMLSFDWGANAALLFGRQKMRAHQETMKGGIIVGIYGTHYDYSASPARSKSVMVPNLGGYAGLSFRYANAKISLGYRADMFFGAVDAGIDTAKKEDRGFYGPFASISVGIGD